MQMIKMMFLGLLLTAGTIFASEQKVVFDLTSGDDAKITKGLIKTVNGLVTYYDENHIDYKIKVVISGNSYKYFVKDLEHSPYKGKLKVAKTQKILAPELAKLHTLYNVEFDMCQAGMKMRKIDPKVLYPYVKAEMNKNIYLVKWQNEGYAYLPIH